MYKDNDPWVICDRTGFKVRKSQTRKQWDGLVVRKQSYEEQHPLDIPPKSRENIAVRDARPRKTDVFLTDNQITAADL